METYKVIVTLSGCQGWHQNGKLHRLDGPAIEYLNGDKEWWVNGERHRLDGPAIIQTNGHQEWWVNGERHRLDGPAIEYVYDDAWWFNGQRLDGPAIGYVNVGKSWFVGGVELSEEEFNKRTQTKELTVADLETMLGYSIKIVK